VGTAPSDLSVADAAVLMRTHHVGNVIIVKEAAGTVIPLGIVTDRDIVDKMAKLISREQLREERGRIQ
jgi:CBS domain-containing protein